MVQKLQDVETNINVSTVENGFIGANFYTEDDGSSYIRIAIKDNNEALNFNNTDMTPRLDLFSSDGSIFTNEPLDILVPEGGVIQYKVSDNVIKHAGRMDAKLFLANSKDSVHVANFYFTITDSGMTGPIGKEIHVDSLQDLVKNVMKENAIGLLDDDFKDKLENDLKVYMEENADTFKGEPGKKGEPFKYEDFTPEQLESLKGPKGDPLKYSDLTQTEKDELTKNLTNQGLADFKFEDNSISTSKLIDQAVTPEKTTFVVSGKNMFDKSKTLVSKVLNNSDGLVESSTYSVSQYFYLNGGESITISKLRNYCFVDDETKTVIPDTTTRTNFTFTAPKKGKFRFTFWTSDIDTIQVEKGDVATTYEPYYLKLSDDISLNKVNIDATSNYVLTKKDNNISFSTLLNGKTLEIRTVKNGSRNDSFNFDRTLYDGKLVHSLSDDITPVRTFTTVGANHGYTSVISVPNTDKTKNDLGSVWSDGNTEYTLLRIVDENLILGLSYDDSKGYVSSISNPSKPLADLSHIRNATHTNNISMSNTITTSQLYPSTGQVNVNYYSDGQLVDTNGEYKCNKIEIVENYQILDYKAIIDFARNNVGKDYADYRDNIQGVLAMSNTFTYYDKGKCTTSHSIRALQKVLMARTGVLQSVSLEHPTYKTFRYVPNVKAINNVDFTKPIDLSTYNTSNYIYRENLIDPTKPVDRYIDYIQNGNDVELAFSMGHIVDKTNSKYDDRLSNVPNILWDFRSTKKSYPTVIENKVLSAGDYFNFEGYRNYFVPDKNTINSNVVKDNQAAYIYIDKLTTTNFISTNYKELIGSQVKVVASDGFELKSDVIDSNGVNYAITKPNGYAILKTI